jgi:hypothetical protein
MRKSASAHLAVQRTEAWRQERIATAAYYLAQKRGFEPGHEQEDWGLAEAQIDAGDAQSSKRCDGEAAHFFARAVDGASDR